HNQFMTKQHSERRGERRTAQRGQSFKAWTGERPASLSGTESVDERLSVTFKWSVIVKITRHSHVIA
ncbi:MAG: hypothetical protein ACRETL_00690, partial [Gammaproteobacteria bacterium]